MFVFLLLLMIGLAVAGLVADVLFEIKNAAYIAPLLVIVVGIVTLTHYLPDAPLKDKYDADIKALQKLCVDAGIATFTVVTVESRFTVLATDSVKAEKE